MDATARIDDALARLELDGTDGGVDLVEYLLRDREASDSLKVAGLLRVAAVDDRLLYDSKSRRQALDLVRRLMSERSLADKYDVDERAQADELCQRLTRVSRDGRSQLEGALTSRLEIEECSAFRKQLLQALNSALGQLTLAPFITFGKNSTEALRQALGTVSNYVSADPSQAAELMAQAQAEINGLLEAYSACQTTVAEPIANRLHDLEQRMLKHFEQSPASKPAQLSVQPGERRHPLHVADLELHIPVVIHNGADGAALDVELIITDALGLTVVTPPIRVARVDPGPMVVEFTAETAPTDLTVGSDALCEYQLSWSNSDGSEAVIQGHLELRPQDHTVDWEMLRYANPYSTDAVSTESQLMGRGMMLDRMISTLNTSAVGSLYIRGQKRVGKTSLAKVALTMMGSNIPGTYIFLEIGEVTNPDPGAAVNNLCRALAEELADRLPGSQYGSDLQVDGSLSPLVRVLKAAVRETPRIVIALDEFDRLPTQLFWRTAEADAFFTGLRAISAIEGVGLVLIGGERMKLIMNAGGVELNRFDPFPVDYLDRRTQWHEFSELVRKPTEGTLEFTDVACEAIYNLTAGNPYYTKQVCREVLNLARDNRDNYVALLLDLWVS